MHLCEIARRNGVSLARVGVSLARVRVSLREATAGRMRREIRAEIRRAGGLTAWRRQ